MRWLKSARREVEPVALRERGTSHQERGSGATRVCHLGINHSWGPQPGDEKSSWCVSPLPQPASFWMTLLTQPIG